MKWPNIKRIWLRELRDQMRDRRTLFTVAVLPMLLYPLMGMVMMQMAQFRGGQTTRILVIGEDQVPESPPLFVKVDGKLELHGAEGDGDSLLEITSADPQKFTGASISQVEAAVDAALEDGDYDAVVYFPPNFSEQLAQLQASLRDGKRIPADDKQIPSPRIIANMAKDKSRIAQMRVDDALRRWRAAIVDQAIVESKIPVIITRPFEVDNVDVAEDSTRRAAVWAKILPFVLMVWALTGAFYPAIDLCAGEKERGTLETLLTSPAQRSEIVWGKLLAVMVFSMATAMLNLLSLGATGTFVMRAMGDGGLLGGSSYGAPPWESLGWLVVALVPAAAMFSALALAIAAMARSSKEGQYYLMPLLLVSMPLMVLAILPGTELTLGISLVPITGLILLLRRLIEGDFAEAVRYALPVMGVTIVCVWLSIRWAIDQFNREEVLFRESEQFSLGLWLKHLVRDRAPTPSISAALFLGVLLLVIRFYSMLMLPMPDTWNMFAITTLITLVGLIALPAIVMAFLLSSRPRETLLLKRAPGFSIFAALLLAACVHPVVHFLSEAVKMIFPVGESTAKQLEVFDKLLAGAPGMWAVVLLLALAPAVCEELAFRGFILSGLRRMGHKWGAIVMSAALFGVAHGLLQQSVMATLTGIVLGYIAVQTGSLWPCIVYHFTNNTCAVLSGTVDEHLITAWPVLQWIFVPAEAGYAFHGWVAIAGGLMAAALLWWFARLPHRASQEEELQKALDHQQAAAGA